jgi:sialidase-1
MIPIRPAMLLLLRHSVVVCALAALCPTTTAANHPAEGSLEPFLGEPRCELQQVFTKDRFPNVVVAMDGTVLACWNGVIVRRSEDGGKTWSGEITVGKGFMGGGVTVDENTGDILAFVEEKHPPAPLTVYRSKDHGRTWRAQTTVIKGNQAGNVPAMHMNEHGITLRHGPNQGRLLRPSRWYAKSNYPAEHFPTHYTDAIYSDDGGQTWQASEPFPEMGTGEAGVAELSDGRIYYNTRRHWAAKREDALNRWVAWSGDGGATWKNHAICKALPDGDPASTYGLMGGLTRLPVQGRDILIFSNIQSPQGRKNGTVWMSMDGGQTWPLKRVIFPGSFAYSSLEAGRPGTPSAGWIYLLFEGGPEGGGTLARFNLSWLLAGEKTGAGEVPAWLGASTGSLRPLPFAKLDPTQPKGVRIPTKDLSADTKRQVMVDKDPARYFGHPSTLLMPDGRTMFAGYALNHGGPPLYYKVSRDGGLTWSEYLTVPEGSDKLRNCPFLHYLKGPDGTWRLFTFVGGGDAQGANSWQSHSLDGGQTWTPMAKNGLESVVASPTIVAVAGGTKYLCWYHTYPAGQPRSGKLLEVRQSASTDGGLTWGDTRVICRVESAAPCEPAVVRSPDGKQLLILMRENARRLNSLMMTSDDEGETWSAPRELPASLTGDRHQPRYAADGRLVIAFRDTATESPTKDHFVAWVGTYDDIVAGREGQYRVKLLHSHAGWDCGYSGLESLPDGTLVATTYVRHQPGEKHAIVSVRFKLSETDAMRSATDR